MQYVNESPSTNMCVRVCVCVLVKLIVQAECYKPISPASATGREEHEQTELLSLP